MGKRKGKRGRAVKNARKSQASQEPEEVVKAPHSFVIHRGQLGKNGHDLMMNFRKMMEPFTASQLKVQKHNVLKDFVHIAGPLNVTHLIVFTKSEIALYLRVIRLPRGPTLTFRIHEYSLAKDVVSSLKKPVVYEKLFSHHPLLVLNNFSGEGLHFKLMTSMFQGMFPSININKTTLNDIRRCLLMNFNSDKTIDLRQFAIRVVPCGLSKGVKKLIQSKVPDLGAYHDVSEFLVKSGNLSESEAELDGPVNHVILPQSISSRGNIASQKSAIRLSEIGPRLKLQLVKIEEGICTGDVLFHEYIHKTPEEIAAIKAKHRRLKQLKAQRRAEQEKNVQRKQQEKEKMSGKKNQDGKTLPVTENGNSDEDDDDEWFRKEVGEKPDEDMVKPLRKKRRLDDDNPGNVSKRRKMSQEESQKANAEALQKALIRRKKRKAAKMKKQRAKRKSSAMRRKKKK